MNTRPRRQLELPFTPKARRELRRVAAVDLHEYCVEESGTGRKMTVKAVDTGHAKRIANQAWEAQFGAAATFLNLRAKLA